MPRIESVDRATRRRLLYKPGFGPQRAAGGSIGLRASDTDSEERLLSHVYPRRHRRAIGDCSAAYLER